VTRVRYALLLLIAAACARDTWSDGRYLLVEGEAAGITFDHVELFFGRHVTDRLPAGLPGYTSATAVTEELERRIAPAVSGVQAIADAPIAHVDLALPAQVADRLGEYVLVIAYRGATPVGIGARADFTAQPSSITRYEIELEAYPTDPATFARWGVGGGGQDCVRWRRGDEVIAVVRDEDLDCDGFLDADVDCDPMTYCAGECTYADLAPCASDATGCVYGRCANSAASGTPTRACAAEACLATTACEADCAGDTAVERLTCALGQAHDSSPDVPLPVKPEGALCTTPAPYVLYLDLPDGVSCVSAPGRRAYGVDSQTAVAFTFDIAPMAMPVPIGSATADCEVKIVETAQPVDTPPILDEIVHFLVPLTTDAGLETSAIVGLTPTPGGCEAQMQVPVVVPVTLEEVATCGP
jgi:hypothetical protein